MKEGFPIRVSLNQNDTIHPEINKTIGTSIPNPLKIITIVFVLLNNMLLIKEDRYFRHKFTPFGF